MDDDGLVEAVTLTHAAPARFGVLGRSAPDAKLVSRVRAGDERAFEAIYDRYHRPLLAFCRHMLGTREEAEDALQHVFVSANKHLVARDEIVDLRPWLYAIARNRCLSVLRARKEAVALDDIPEPSVEGLSVAGEVEQRQDLKDVLGDLRRLPDDQRAALVLSELGALSHDEIAGVLDVRRDKVKALVFQARESLAGWRGARDTDCREIREQLANLRGGALRRAPLRKHLEACDSCRDFRGEVRRQREAMALLLPVVPSLALKAKIIGAVTASSALPAGVGGGIAASAVTSGLAGGTAASTGGALSALGGGLVAKSLVVAAIAGTAGGGYAVVDSATESQKVTPPPASRMAPLVAPAATPPAERPAVRSPAGTPAEGSKSAPGTNPGRGSATGEAKAKGKGKSDAATPGVSGLPPVAQDAPGQTKERGTPARPDKAPPPTAQGRVKDPPAARDRTRATPVPNGPAAPAADRPAKQTKAAPDITAPAQTDSTASTTAGDSPASSRPEPARPDRGKPADAGDVVTAVLAP
jgi:RNA polymerase sigma factor (sigma-70 family)